VLLAVGVAGTVAAGRLLVHRDLAP
jgi:hypothetical protein